MQINVETTIRAPVEDVWNAITDFEGAADRISAIDAIEILEKPESGLVGLKWKETRTMFGKQATEVMWITGAKEGESYDVRAESNGMVYESRLSVAGQGDQALLRMTFGGEAQGLLGRLMAAVMGVFFKGATVKALRQDLEDIKSAVEKKPEKSGSE